MAVVACAHGVGGLKACIHSLAIETVLRENNIPVAFRTGVSGGSLAAMSMSFSVTNGKGIPWLVKRISEIDEGELYDTDWQQQLIDRGRRFLKLPKRKGDTQMLGWFRGNGLDRAIKKLIGDLGTVTSPFEIVSCALDQSVDPDLVPLHAVNLNNGSPLLKKVRRFTNEGNSTNSMALLSAAVRSSVAIPFVIRPNEIDGISEVDGGVLTLTSEEVAADWLAEKFGERSLRGEEKVALVISDMESLPDEDDNNIDDLIELGVGLVRTVGAHIQSMNRQYTVRKLEPLKMGITRFTPPQSTVKMKQFETSKAPEMYEAYVASLRSNPRTQALVNWLKDGFPVQ